MRAAAERAASLGSQDQALGYLRDAITITDEPGERAALDERAGIAATDAGRYDEAIPLFEDASQAFVAIGASARAAHTLARIGAAYILGGQTTQAIERLEAGRDVVGTGDGEGHARLFAELARGYMLDWRPYDETLRWCDRALDIAERLDLVPVIADVLITQGTALMHDHARRGMAMLVGALQLAESLDDVRVQLRAINNMGAFLEDDDPALVLEFARRGVVLAQRLGNAEIIASHESTIAWRRFFAGQPREALAMLDAIERDEITPFIRGQIDKGREWLLTILGDRDAIAAVRRSIETDSASITHHEYVAYESGNQADLALLQGHVAEAIALAEQFLATGVDPYLGNLIVARCAFRMGDVARARVAVEGVDAAPRKGRTVEARRLALRAALAAMEGDEQSALESFDEAFRAFRDLGLLFELAWYQVDMVAVLGGTAQAAAVAAEARAAFESMGAHGLADQVEALTTGRSAPDGARRKREPAIKPAEVP